MRRTTLLLTICLLMGCQGLGDMLGSMEKPRVSVKAVRFADLSLDSITLEFDVGVTNPYSVALPVTKAAFRLSSDGRPFLSGASETQGMIPAGKTEVYPIRATVPFASLLETLSGVRPGAVVPWEAALDLSVDTPALGTLTLPLEKSGDLPVPAVPDVRLARVELVDASLSRVAAKLSIGIGNGNEFPIDLSSGDFRVSFAGVEVGGAELARAVSFDPGGEGRVEVPIGFSPLSVGVAAFQALTGSGVDYRLTGSLAANTRWGALELPFSAGGRAPVDR